MRGLCKWANYQRIALCRFKSGYCNFFLFSSLAPRVNKPPRADISPKEQTITLPTNEVVLDGSSECFNLINYAVSLL